jgi:hypothetical protein
MIRNRDEVFEMWGKITDKYDSDPYFSWDRLFESVVDDDWLPDHELHFHLKDDEFYFGCSEVIQPRMKPWDQAFLNWLQNQDLEAELRSELIAEVMSQEIYKPVSGDWIWMYEVTHEQMADVLNSFNTNNIEEFKSVVIEYIDLSEGWTAVTPKSHRFHQKMHQIGFVPTVFFDDRDEDLEDRVVSILYGDDYALGARGPIFCD